MLAADDADEDGLTSEQFAWLVAASVGLGALLLALVLGITGVAHLTGAGGGIDGPPDAAFSVVTEERGDDLVANVTHRGGHAVHPDSLLIEVDGELRDTWGEMGGEGPGLVAEGHSLVVTDVQVGDEVRILWIDGDGEHVVLDRNTVRQPGD